MSQVNDINGIFERIDSIWWDEWVSQTWRYELWVKNPKTPIPKPFPESLDIMYWEPHFHPINAIEEVNRALDKMHKQLFKEYIILFNQYRDVVQIIKKGKSGGR